MEANSSCSGHDSEGIGAVLQPVIKLTTIDKDLLDSGRLAISVRIADDDAKHR